MSLNKKRMVREIGRRTRLSNRDVQRVVETLVDVWTEELVSGGRIEIEHFMVIDVHTIERSAKRLVPKRRFQQIKLRTSRTLRNKLNEQV